MNKAYILIVAMLIQLAVPLSLLNKNETIVRKGTEFKFKTRPVDPYDVMRGRYVALGIEANKYTGDVRNFNRGMYVYALIDNDENGFAMIADLKIKKPSHGDYLRTKVRYTNSKECFLDMPLNRFYMNEKDAPKAEQLYRNSVRRVDSKKPTYIKVKIYKGSGVIVDLIIDNKTIKDLLEIEYLNK